ncbi:MAG: methyltransferase [Nanoarchaeota archaeon]|nr:methyltransferase [Nanoarchaeota archaeon]
MTDHYFSKHPTSVERVTPLICFLRGQRLEFTSASGMFSIGKVDMGSRVLIEESSVEGGMKILDYGCGWGVVGIALAKAFISSTVEMIDVNQRALKHSKMNIRRNNVSNCSIVGTATGDYDTILFNPPQKVGKLGCFEMIANCQTLLKKGGSLQLVARHNKGGKVLREKMEELFGNVADIAKSGGFRIYFSSKL